ncbi:MAG: PqiC family protein, partial [Halieaceae bacterium]
YLNRNSMVFNRDGNKLKIATYARWAEPLESGISRVLSLNLATKLNTEDIQVFPWHPTRSPDYAVGLRLLGLDSNNQRARLVAEWSLRKGGEDGTEKRRIVRLETATAASEMSPNDVAAAYSDLLGQLSDTIARAIADDMSQSAAAQGGI